MSAAPNRREFIKAAGIGSAGLVIGVQPALAARRLSPNEKLNIGVIGTGGRAGEDLKEVSTENIVALCYVDDLRLNAAAQKYPGAKLYTDFRKLIDQKDIDAVVVGTPDHTHAVAAMRSEEHTS